MEIPFNSSSYILVSSRPAVSVYSAISVWYFGFGLFLNRPQSYLTELNIGTVG